MEHKMGEIFEFDGKWYQCVEGNCVHCSIKDEACEQRIINDVYKLNCVFKKLEKVGVPFSCNYYGDSWLIMMQEYQLFDGNVTHCHSMPQMFVTDIKHKRIAIEIKVNKEDMGDNDDIRPYDELFSPGTVSNTKHLVTSNLKPFDLEAAKQGKPVCTRDGHKARIICFDAKDTQPIIGLYEKNIDGMVREYLCSYHTDGRMYDDQDTGYDLMMLPEKKEGWVNIYYNNSTSSHRGCGCIYDTKEQAIKGAGNAYITTVKINWEE